MIGFLIRTTFWFSLVLLMLPLDPKGVEEAQTVSPVEALGAARAAIGDIAGLCERQPEICVTGRAAFETIGIRAREGARIAYEVLDERFGEETQPAAALASDGPDLSITTGGVEPKPHS